MLELCAILSVNILSSNWYPLVVLGVEDGLRSVCYRPAAVNYVAINGQLLGLVIVAHY